VLKDLPSTKLNARRLKNEIMGCGPGAVAEFQATVAKQLGTEPLLVMTARASGPMGAVALGYLLGLIQAELPEDDGKPTPRRRAPHAEVVSCRVRDL
jgi:hypothetical protein